MPGYLKQNHLGAEEALGPGLLLERRYALGLFVGCDPLDSGERICPPPFKRLMVTGLYALLLGVRPDAVHGWYPKIAVYVDAVEWVGVAPITLGMSQFADGGLMASKPYAATGKYIQRMGNHCVPVSQGSRESDRKAMPAPLHHALIGIFSNSCGTKPPSSKNPRMSLQVRESQARLPKRGIPEG